MNYQEMLLRTMRKVPDTYRGYVNTSAIDRAEGAKQTQRDLNYQRLAQMRDQNNANVNFAQQRLDTRRNQFNQGYDFRQDQMDSAQNNMLVANLLGGAGVGVNYLQGRNQAKANQALTSLIQDQTKFYNSLNQPFSVPEQRGRLYDHGGFMNGNSDMGFGGSYKKGGIVDDGDKTEGEALKIEAHEGEYVLTKEMVESLRRSGALNELDDWRKSYRITPERPAVSLEETKRGPGLGNRYVSPHLESLARGVINNYRKVPDRIIDSLLYP